MRHPLLFASTVLILTASCPVSEFSARPAAPAPHHALPSSADALAAPAEFSIYQLESSWTDQHGAVRTLGTFSGRPMLVALVYTNCADACPRTLIDLKRIEAAVNGVGFLLVSIDPERDTPGRLREFADGARLDSARYTLLRGADADLLELAAALGVRYRRVENGDFVHSNVISLLDENGTVVYRQNGFGQVDRTIAQLRRTVAK